MAQPIGILEALPVGIWVAVVPTGEVSFSNAAFKDILGIGPQPGGIETASGTYGILDHHGAPYPVDRLPFSRVMATGQSVSIDDLVIRRPDGTTICVRALGAPLSDASGMTHVVIAFIDITSEFVATRERKEALNRLQLALEHAPMGIFAVDCSGTITLSEGAALGAMGLKPGQLVGRSIFEVYAGEAVILDYLRRGLQGESLGYSVELGGSAFDTWLGPQHDANGVLTGTVGVFTDVSELRRLQLAAVRDDRLKAIGTMAASVAHEINNPLTVIDGNLAEIRRQVSRAKEGAPLDVDRIEAALAAAERGFGRIMSITRQLGTFTRQSHGEVSAVDLHAVVASVATLLGKELEGRAHLDLLLAHTSLVRADEARTAQLVLNLVTNAVEAGARAGAGSNVVTLRTAEENGVWLHVEDTGPGIPVALRDKVFEPFVTTKDAGSGTGMGLFICRTIVDQFGGRISVGDAPSGGARLSVWLPVAPRPAKTPPPKGENGEGRYRVLLVDDEPLVRDILARALRAGGFDSVMAGDGAEALTLLKSEPFDLVYCDLMMRGITGMALHDILKAEAPELLDRIVFMTGGAYTTQAQTFVLANPGRCVGKPFNIVETTRVRINARLKVNG